MSKCQYCTAYEDRVVKLESKLAIGKKALKKIYEGDPEGVYAGPLAKEALRQLEGEA